MKTENLSFFRKYEKALIDRIAARIPQFIGTKALTFLSLFSSVLVFFSYYLSGRFPPFLFIASFFIILQWIFDCLDGEIGRRREQGFFRWGFYMDHLFDYFFMTSIVFGWRFLYPQAQYQMLILYFIFSAFMVNSFLLYGTVRDREPDFLISFGRFSPIEFRLSVISFNLLVFFFSETMRHLVQHYLPYINIFLFCILLIVIYFTQDKLSKIDISEIGRAAGGGRI